MIQGEPGTKVTLTVLHEGSREAVDIDHHPGRSSRCTASWATRRKPDDPKEWDFCIDKEHKIGYVRLTSFSETTRPRS